MDYLAPRLILSLDFKDANNLLAGVMNLKGFKVSKSKSIDNNGKMHLDLDEFHKQYSKLELNATVEVLKKEAQKGTIEIDNKLIRPTPLGIERCKLDKSLYS